MRSQKLRSSVLALALPILALSLAGGNAAGEREEDRLAGRFRDRPSRFVVLLQLEEAGITGLFQEVSGLGSENEVLEFRDGSDPDVVRKVPGQLKWNDIELKRGVTPDASLWQWRRMVESGNIADARTNGRIVLLDRGFPVATWSFVNAWPTKIAGPELSGKGNDLAIEGITIAHEGILRQ